MADITLDELRAKYPPEDREEYDRAYAAATLTGQLAELGGMAGRARLSSSVAAAMGQRISGRWAAPSLRSARRGVDDPVVAPQNAVSEGDVPFSGKPEPEGAADAV